MKGQQVLESQAPFSSGLISERRNAKIEPTKGKRLKRRGSNESEKQANPMD